MVNFVNLLIEIGRVQKHVRSVEDDVVDDAEGEELGKTDES